MSVEATRRAVLQMLEKKLLPQVLQPGGSSILLMEPEYLRHSGHRLSFHAGQPLQYGKLMRSPISMQAWHEQQVHAARYPCLHAVVEGEVDWRIGVVQAGEGVPDEQLAASDYMVVPLQENTFFLTPAGVPYTDGRGVHWERTGQRKNQAIVFWMIILPSGFLCHYCRSSASQHHSHTQFFVLCPALYPLIGMLVNELRDAQKGDEVIIHAHLQAILSYAYRALNQTANVMLYELKASPQSLGTLEANPSQHVLQRARAYIETHLQEPLSPATVATHAYLSPRHLERYFRRELGMSIMDYVVQRRIETARELLQGTNLLVRHVGELVGYTNQSSFTQIFKRYTGMSPRDCRRKQPKKHESGKRQWE